MHCNLLSAVPRCSCSTKTNSQGKQKYTVLNNQNDQEVPWTSVDLYKPVAIFLTRSKLQWNFFLWSYLKMKVWSYNPRTLQDLRQNNTKTLSEISVDVLLYSGWEVSTLASSASGHELNSSPSSLSAMVRSSIYPNL